MQPCDVTIFRPLKVEWKEVCKVHKQRSSTSITRHNFCPLFKEAFDKASKPSTIINGFETCGLYPLNADAIDYPKCISTRREEIFPKLVEAINEPTAEDYISSLKVVEYFLGEKQTVQYNAMFDHGTDVKDEKSSIFFVENLQTKCRAKCNRV